MQRVFGVRPRALDVSPRRRQRMRGVLAAVFFCCGFWTSSAVWAGNRVAVDGLTFFVTESPDRYFVVRAESAEFTPSQPTTVLNTVRVRLVRPRFEGPLDLRCERARVSLYGNAFKLMGSVEGRDADGRRFETEWLEFDEKGGRLFTSAPVRLIEGESVVEAGALDYDLETRAIRLTGGTRVRTVTP